MRWLAAKLDPKGSGYISDYEVLLERKDTIRTIHTTRASAQKTAQAMASSNPGVQYAVFCVDKVYETTKPKIIAKEVNDRGELVVASDG